MNGHSLLLFDLRRSSLFSSQVYFIHLTEDQQDDRGISSFDNFLLYYFYAAYDFFIKFNRIYSLNNTFLTSLNSSFNLFLSVGTNYVYKFIDLAYTSISDDFNSNIEKFQFRLQVYWIIVLSLNFFYF